MENESEKKEEAGPQQAGGFQPYTEHPHYRVNAKQSAKGLWQQDITVYLVTPTVAWPDGNGSEKQMTAAEIWAILMKEQRQAIEGRGDAVVPSAA